MERPILIVDDSDDDARLLALELKRAGVVNPIVTVNSGPEAIDYLEGAKAFANRAEHPIPSVMFLDLKMPGVDGYYVLNWVRKQPQLKSMLVVVLSGAREVFDVNRAYLFGANSFLTKPFTEGDLINLQKGFPGPWKIASSSNSH
jgi:CheY-like chemotaxis protein